MRKTEMLFAIATAALFVLYLRKQAAAAVSPHAAGKNEGNTVPGYWADVQ